MTIEFVDLFSGAGGLTTGLRQAGLKQAWAVDHDADSCATYRANHPRCQVSNAGIEDISPRDVLGRLGDPSRYVLAGGPPCQLFSRLHQKQPTSSHIIFQYLKLVRALRAPYLVFENVPQIQSYGGVWQAFLRTLEDSGYRVWSRVMNAGEFGLAQVRKRLVVIASRHAPIDPVFRRRKPTTVREAIADLPDADPTIPNHNTMKMSTTNRKRIRSIRTDGGCARKSPVFSDSYSRMFWDRPGPTITTRCISFSNGRFGHPQYDRAITVREAARLQGFADRYVFHGGVWSTARQVGNAVPPPLARWMGRSLLRHAALEQDEPKQR